MSRMVGRLLGDAPSRRVFALVSALGVAFVQSAAVAQTFGEWMTFHQVPESSRGPADRNGPLRLSNLEAYAFGLDPFSATPADLPRLVEVDPATGLRLAYRRHLAAGDVQWIVEGSPDARLWTPLTTVSEQVRWTEGTVEGRELLVAQGVTAPYFLRLSLELREASPFVLVPGGSLPALSPLGAIQVGDFRIGRTEVTYGEWREVREWAQTNGYDLQGIGSGCADNHPVQTVNWYDVIKWCNAKSEKEGLTPAYRVGTAVYRREEYGPSGSETITWNPLANGYRLPSEAEWEYAARGGQLTQATEYSGGNDLSLVGWWRGNSGGAECALDNGVAGPTADLAGTWPVGRKAANELGLSDMSGNVWEWCWDPRGTPVTGRAIRGGSWLFMEGSARLASRNSYRPSDRYYYSGFRLARN